MAMYGLGTGRGPLLLHLYLSSSKGRRGLSDRLAAQTVRLYRTCQAATALNAQRSDRACAGEEQDRSRPLTNSGIH